MIFRFKSRSVSLRWRPAWGESQERGWETAGGWDSAGVPAGLSWRGVRWESPVSRPWCILAQVWQLLLALEVQNRLLQSILHQISLESRLWDRMLCVRVCYEIDGRKERSKTKKCMGCPLLGKGQRDLTWVCVCFDVYANFMSVSVMLFESKRNGFCTLKDVLYDFVFDILTSASIF